MKRIKKSLKRYLPAYALAAIIVTLITLLWPTTMTSYASQTNALATPKYVVLGWNNLGMHCQNGDFSTFCILPPYNVLWAQVIKVGDPPQIVTSGVKVEYSFPQNTYSAGSKTLPDKTNFWTYAKDLFGVKLAPNVGLTGKSLSGKMDVSGDHFIAEGIPLTEYRDIDVRTDLPFSRWPRYPFQLAYLAVKDVNTNELLTSNIIVAPVSSEINCASCHSRTGDATMTYPIQATNNVFLNILAIHDYLNPGKYTTPLVSQTPVLCADCHASAALGMNGLPGVSSLSNAIHNHHKDLMDITPDTAGCYHCHPGTKTKCLRCVMSQNYAVSCVTCHGTMSEVAQNPSPWLNEPRCDSALCHGSGYELDNPLYRESKGHNGIYCAGCHDSPHVIAKSRQYNDSIKFTIEQGTTGTLKKCTTCHLTKPTDAFVHKMVVKN